jgi:hypothetical protein
MTFGKLVKGSICVGAFVAGCVGVNTARTVTAQTQLQPSQGVVIGTLDATNTRALNESPTLYLTAKSDKGQEYSIEMAQRESLKSAFYVALPAGKYKFANGTAGGGPSTARAMVNWADANVYFEVKPGEVTCIGGVEAQVAEGAANVLQTAAGTFKGKWKVNDDCDATSASFKEQFGALGEAKKELAVAK